MKHHILRSGAVALGLLAAGAAPAAAEPLLLRTSGTITSGTDALGLFGAAGGNLAGRSYTESIYFSGLGSSTFIVPGVNAVTSGPISGTLTATVGGASYSAPFSISFGAFISETPGEITGFNTGDNGAGLSITANNTFFNAAGVFPADFAKSFTYTGTSADLVSNSNEVSFGVGTTTFTATPSSVTFLVPEPGSLALLGAGLPVLALLRRRRRPEFDKTGRKAAVNRRNVRCEAYSTPPLCRVPRSCCWARRVRPWRSRARVTRAVMARSMMARPTTPPRSSRRSTIARRTAAGSC